VADSQRSSDLRALRIARAEAGMTLGELAEKADVALNTISRIERGAQEPQAATLYKLAHALGTTAAELIRQEEEGRDWDPKADNPRSLRNYIERRGLTPERLTADEFQNWYRETQATLYPNAEFRKIVEEATEDLGRIFDEAVEEARLEAVEDYRATLESHQRITGEEEAARQARGQFVSKVLNKLKSAINGGA